MKIPIQIALESAALTLGSAVLFASFFQFNGWLFADWAYRENVTWVFLPAGFRIILVLVLGLPGTLGIMLGTPEFDSKSRFFPFSPIRPQQNQALTADVLNFR